MGRYLTRLLQLFVSLFFLSLLCFGLLKLFPGSPFAEESALDPQVTLELQKFYGLKDNFGTQLKVYYGRILHGDLGTSIHFPGRSVRSLIWEFGQTSFVLGFVAFLSALLFSGLYGFVTRRPPFRHRAFADALLLVGVSIPTLAAGPLLIWLLSVHFNLFPVALLETRLSYVLPIFILALKPTLSLSRVLAHSLDEALQSQYIQTARAFGFSEKKILFKWALKNCLTSYVSQAASLLAALISGSFLVEVLFAIPGLGYQFVESVLNRDWPLILGITLFYGFFLLLIHWIVDLLLEFLNPRLRSP